MSKQTPLYNIHIALEGKIVPFAGYDLPVQYPAGIIAEHNAVRQAAGLFDVSHMGEIEISGENAPQALARLFTTDLETAEAGETRYGLLLNEYGGVVDDLLVYKLEPKRFLLVVNASNTEKDFAHVLAHLPSGAEAKNLSEMVGQLALQGPASQQIMQKITDAQLPARNHFVNCILKDLKGNIIAEKSHVSRTGYTGEDGFEIYCAAANAAKVHAALMEAGKEFGLLPCGLGCRDTLRLESAYPLYGHELSEEYLANEVGLAFAMKSPHEYIGKAALQNSAAKYVRRGAFVTDKGIAREHCAVYEVGGQTEIGIVTSGTHSPTLGSAIAMLRLEKQFSDIKTVEIDVRGRRLKAEITPMPFYKRG